MLNQVLVDRYEIRQPLGKKVGRQTWLAWDRQAERSVVVKLLRFNQDFVWDDLKLFEREAETLRSLAHPQIPRYLDFCEVALPDAQGFALVQSHVEGRSLEAHLQAGRRFSEADVKQLAQALLEILIYLHSRNPAVIHRDIKPSNILLTDRSGNSVGQVYLVDFGSVQTLAAREGGTMTIVGTYGYMPPEQFGGQTSPASDLYSLGATLIYLLTGRHPADIPQKRMRLQFEPLVNLSPELTQWLGHLIAPDLDDRLTSADQALQWLRQPPAPIDRPVILSKPSQCRVELSSLVDQLTIRIPQLDNSASSRLSKKRGKKWLLKLAVLGSGCGVLSLLFGVPLLASLPLVLLMVGLSRGAIADLKSHFQRGKAFSVLQVDQDHITWSIESSGKSQPLSSSPRAAIHRLEYHDRGIASAVKVWAGKRPYELGGDGSLSPIELQWLAEELSFWLKLPIQQIQQHQLFSADQLPNAEDNRCMVRFQDGTDFSAIAPVEKPAASQIVLLKQSNWIEILIPPMGMTEADPASIYARLYIDHEHIRLTLADKQNPPPSMRQAISRLEHQSHPDAATSAVRIWASRRVYELGGDGTLSLDESRWLAAELSNWLRLPVQIM